MKKYMLLGFLTFTVTAQAQNIYFGATSKSAKKNEFCSYSISVPKFLAAADAPAVVKTLVTALNANGQEEISQMEQAYNSAIADKSNCTEYMYASQQSQYFRVANQIGATVISLVTTNSGYTGGAHGWTGISGTTFNTVTGDRYTNLGAFFGQSKLDALKALILEKAKVARPGLDPSFGWNDWSAKYKSVGEIENFYVSDYGLVVYFQQYEIGPYSDGIIEAQLFWYEMEQVGLNGSVAAQALMSNKPN